MPTKELSKVNYNGDEYIIVDSTASTKFSALGHHHTIGEIDGEIASYSFVSPISEGANHTVSLTTVPVSKGGTGTTSITSGEVVIGNGQNAITTRGIATSVGTSTTNNNLITAGAVKAELAGYSAIGHQHTTSDISGLITYSFDSPLSEDENHTVGLSTVPVNKGGTGTTSLTSGQVLIGNGTNAVTTKNIDATSGGTQSSTDLITSGAVYAGLADKSPIGHHHTTSDINGYIDYEFDSPITEDENHHIGLTTVPVSKGGTGNAS